MRTLITPRRIARATALIAALAATACSRVLDTEPYDRVPATQQIVDASTAQAALTGAYAQLEASGMYALDIQLLGEMASDNASWGGTYQFLHDITINNIQIDNTEVLNMWSALYKQIDRDNVILERVPQITSIPSSTSGEILGEAYFLRALSYSNLVKYWGDVPMPLKPVVAASRCRRTRRTPVAQVYTEISRR